MVFGLPLLLLILTACGPVSVRWVEETPTVVIAELPTVQVVRSATPSPYPTYVDPTATPEPTATPTPDYGDLPPGPAIAPSDVAQEQAAQRQNPFLLTDMVQDFRDPERDTPLALTAELNTPAITWDNWWCAANENTLSRNLDQDMDVTYWINNAEVPQELAYSFLQWRNNGTVCRVTVFFLDNWPAGEHTLEYRRVLADDVSDGYESFAPGTYSVVYSVTAPEPAPEAAPEGEG